jgi:hypothetical protein
MKYQAWLFALAALREADAKTLAAWILAGAK